jgi:hypothetical protein
MEARSYGTNGAVRLHPTDGNALLAHQLGRRGLLIHGGDSRASAPAGLRPTHGCLRIANGDMARLRMAILDAGADAGMCSEDGYDIEIVVEDM